MNRLGPLITLGSVLVLAVIFLLANTQVAKPGSAAAAVPAASATATPTATAVPLHALYAGRSSGDQVTVAIAVNGRKAAADLNAGQASEVSLQGSVNGGKVTLTGQNGTALTGSVSGLDMFGTVTGFLGQSFPFSAAQAVVEAVYTGRSSGNQVTLGGRHRRRQGRGLRLQRPDHRGLAAGLGERQPGQPDRQQGREPHRLPVRPGHVRHGHGERRGELPVLGRAVPAPGRGLSRPGSRSTGWPPGSAGRCCPTGPSSEWPSRGRPSTLRRCSTSATTASPWTAPASRPPPSPERTPSSARETRGGDNHTACERNVRDDERTSGCLPGP